LLAQRPLHRHRRLERVGWTLEHGEELVGAGLDDVPTAIDGGAFEDRAHAIEQRAIAVAETVQQRRRALHVGEQHGDETRRQVRRVAPPAELALRLELAGDEADRDDAEALGRPEQTRAGLLARLLVIELDLVEAGEGVADVGGVVDRQATTALRVDIGEGVRRQLGSIRRLESGHGRRH
jgi:hypothetical protein